MLNGLVSDVTRGMIKSSFCVLFTATTSYRLAGLRRDEGDIFIRRRNAGTLLYGERASLEPFI